ncbi:WD40-repeat-containing domain protein [Spinellus fusiger]|nr:WD40-repeat-containing domain protein [Spinellus fusiger]
MHTDWVNDVVVCKGGECVVSASNDRTVKLLRPSSDPSSTTIHTLGLHSDYAKCLAYASQAGWVASGGLDKKVHLWDMEKGTAALTIPTGPHSLYSSTSASASAPPLLPPLPPPPPPSSFSSSDLSSFHDESKASIYAMATIPSGTLLATGSPEKVIRLWDPRTGQRVGKLTGHTDNIRALIMSQQGDLVLSGSSDATLKLWSVRAQRCLATYETHADSVWSLYSNHPQLHTFYAGSRDGLVTKTEIASGHCETLETECIGLLKEKTGVMSIVALEDTYVWTATSSAHLHRWVSVPDRETRAHPSRHGSLAEVLPTSSIVRLSSSSPPPPPSSPSLPPHTTYMSMESSSSVSHPLTLYAGSVVSMSASYQDGKEKDEKEETDSSESVVPLRLAPESVVEGSPGITAHVVLSNRRHVVTQDTCGEVITVELHESSCFDCEMYADEADLPEDYSISEDQRINLGKWVLVHLFEHFITAEVENQKNGRVGYQEHKEADTSSTHIKTPLPPPLRDGIQQSTSTTTTTTTAATLQGGEDAVDTPEPVETLKLPLAAITTDFNSNYYRSLSPKAHDFHGPFTAPPSIGVSTDYFSGMHHGSRDSSVQLPAPVVLNNPISPVNSSFLHRLKSLSVKPKTPPISTLEETLETLDEKQDKQQQEQDKQQQEQQDKETEEPSSIAPSEVIEPYTPPSLADFPPLALSPHTALGITEESAEASTCMDLYRGTLVTLGTDTRAVLQSAPAWLLSFLLFNKVPAKETIKLTFVLYPMENTDTPELPGG